MGRSGSIPPPISQVETGKGEIDDSCLDCDGQIVTWLGSDGANVFIEIQGSLVCVAVRKGYGPLNTGKRGKVIGFSAASRLRLFKIINRLSFDLAGRSSFLTMTWRDDLGRPTKERLTQARTNFHADLEQLLQRPVAGLWRVEWKNRLSGRYLGTPMPHVHEIIFSVPWIDRDWIEDRWAMAIGTRKYVDVKIKAINDIRKCLNYVGKYVAKLPDDDLPCPLGINAYLIHGRPWGKYRYELFPLAPLTYVRVPPSSLVKRIRAIAKAAWGGVTDVESRGFAVFGPAAEKIKQLLADYSCHIKPGGVGFRQPSLTPGDGR